jgi:hypothetical protein
MARRLKVTLPIRYAVLDHEEPCPHPTSDQTQYRRRIISAASPCLSAMSAGQCAFQVRAHHEAALSVNCLSSPPVSAVQHITDSSLTSRRVRKVPTRDIPCEGMVIGLRDCFSGNRPPRPRPGEGSRRDRPLRHLLRHPCSRRALPSRARACRDR